MKKIYTTILGNIHKDFSWQGKLQGVTVEYLDLDQWTAQKSRFVVRSTTGREYAVALSRHAGVSDGDVIEYIPEENLAVIIRVALNPVMVIDLSALAGSGVQQMIRTAVELGHAIGNQHWPAVVKGMQVYVPLTVDRTVMRSVMETHHLEGLSYEFHPGQAVIPYLAPHEVRRLFGGTEQEGHLHAGEGHTHTYADGKQRHTPVNGEHTHVPAGACH